MILDAEERGLVAPGGVIVEGTAGNTGIGLALVANARGYRIVIVIPETQSQEKMDMLRLCGAELMPVPAKPYRDPGNYVRVSERVASDYAQREPNGAWWANQWDNPANWQGHYKSTGPEIWDQTEGRVDGFICAIGTGGTLAGVSTFLREANPDMKIGLADPEGAAMYSYFSSGELASEGIIHYRGNRPGTDHRKRCRSEGRSAVPYTGRRGPSCHVRLAERGGVVPWGVFRDQCCGRNSHGP